METKIIVAGSRTFNDAAWMERVLFAIDDEYEACSIVSGMAEGADMLAYQFCKKHGIKCYEFPADWSQGRSAGYERNLRMANFADVLVAFWDKESEGTHHMIKAMQNRNKQTLIYTF
jgi:hypothetical protein